MNDTKTIQINVQSDKRIAWSEIRTFELNDLKESKDRDIQALINAIINQGFNFPVFIWANRRYVIDGAGRIKALEARR